MKSQHHNRTIDVRKTTRCQETTPQIPDIAINEGEIRERENPEGVWAGDEVSWLSGMVMCAAWVLLGVVRNDTRGHLPRQPVRPRYLYAGGVSHSHVARTVVHTNLAGDLMRPSSDAERKKK